MLKAAITTLLLGSASIAAADPSHDFEQRGRMHRRPVLLADDVALGDSGRRAQFIELDTRQNIRQLRLDLQQGRTQIQTITIVFHDGHRERIAVNRQLSRREPSLTVDLPHAGVRGIFIDTQLMRFARGAGNFRRANAAVVDVVGLRGSRR